MLHVLFLEVNFFEKDILEKVQNSNNIYNAYPASNSPFYLLILTDLERGKHCLFHKFKIGLILYLVSRIALKKTLLCFSIIFYQKVSHDKIRRNSKVKFCRQILDREAL